MIEWFCAWSFLLCGLFQNNPQLCIAAGLFAIAYHLDDWKKQR